MIVIPLDSPWKAHQPLHVFDFLISLLCIWKDFKLLSSFMLKWIQPPVCSDHSLHRILSSYWLAHLYLMKKSEKCCSILVWITGCWNSLLTSRNPKNNLCISHIFGARFGGKDHGLSACKPWSKQEGGWINFCMNQLRTLKFYQIFKIKNKKKPIEVDVLFKAYPMIPLSCRSNQAGLYL
jgi:hypothetical protein